MKLHIRTFFQRLIIWALFFAALLSATTCAHASDFWSWNEEEDTANQLDDVPAYWMDELKQGAKAINIALMEAGSNKSAFLFYSDIHWSYNSQQSPALLKYLYKHTGMTKTIFGGDVVADESTDYDDMSYIWEWRSMVKDLPNHHSVVGNHDDGNTTNYLFDEDYVYGYLLAPEETPDIVRGDQGLYYYIDVPAEKTRYLYLDTASYPILYDPIQTQFLLDSLKTTPDGWHIVAVGHMWYNPDYDQEKEPISILTYEGSMVLGILDAYNSRSAGVARAFTDVQATVTVKLPYDFSNCGAKVEFCIGGHTHRDFDATSPDGIPVILVETDSHYVRSDLSHDNGTTNESSVNGIIADYDAKKITIVRVGRGESRVVPLK